MEFVLQGLHAGINLVFPQDAEDNAPLVFLEPEKFREIALGSSGADNTDLQVGIKCFDKIREEGSFAFLDNSNQQDQFLRGDIPFLVTPPVSAAVQSGPAKAE